MIEPDIIGGLDEGKLVEECISGVPVGQPLDKKLDARPFSAFVDLDRLPGARHRVVLDLRPISDSLEVIELSGDFCGFCYRCSDAHERAEYQSADLNRIARYPVKDQSLHLHRVSKAGILAVIGPYPRVAHAP